MHALLFLAAIALTFVSSCAVENSTTAQQAMGATLCRTGWQLEFEGERSSSGARRPASGTSVGVLRVVTDNAAPFCVGPAGERDRCQSCILVMFSPFLLCVALFLGEFVKQGTVNLDMNNEILAAVTIVHDGQVRHQPTAQALAAKILAAQWPLAKKAKLADYVIRNDGTLEALRRQVKKLYRQILENGPKNG